jgi:UrcA family protein
LNAAYLPRSGRGRKRWNLRRNLAGISDSEPPERRIVEERVQGALRRSIQEVRMSLSKFLSPIRMTLLATTMSALWIVPAVAQDDDYATGSSESVIVTAPDFHAERNTLGLPGKLTLRREVSYNDLDLRTHDGARELRHRADVALREVCDQLRDAYPVKEQPLEHCYTNGYKQTMLNVEKAIDSARSDYYRAEYRGDRY